MCHFRAQNDPFVLNKQAIFGTNHCHYFHLPISPFHSRTFNKNSYSGSRVMTICHFRAKMIHLPQTKFFFWKTINIILIYLLAPFIVQNFQRIVTRMCNFWVQNGPFPQMRISSVNLIISLVSFIHAYLYAKNQSQILIYQ